MRPIDAGADVVIGHHAHLLRGIEVYKGKPIFHGLGNFVTVTHALSPIGVTDQTTGRCGARPVRLRARPGDARVSVPSRVTRRPCSPALTVDPGRPPRASYLPCVINQRSQPEVVGHDERGQQVFDYVERITRQAGFLTRFEWQGDAVSVQPG